MKNRVNLKKTSLNRFWSVRTKTSKVWIAWMQLKYQFSSITSITSKMRCLIVLYNSIILWLSCKLMKINELNFSKKRHEVEIIIKSIIIMKFRISLMMITIKFNLSTSAIMLVSRVFKCSIIIKHCQRTEIKSTSLMLKFEKIRILIQLSRNLHHVRERLWNKRIILINC